MGETVNTGAPGFIRIGLVVSSAGGALRAAIELWKDSTFGRHLQFCLVTDRETPFEKFAADLGWSQKRLKYRSPEDFSSQAADFFQAEGCLITVAFFTRYLSPQLFEKMPVLNFHPSLLPAFKGLRSVEDAFELKCPLLGLSVHLINEKYDEGRLVYQLADPTGSLVHMDAWMKLSFLQKVEGLLILFESLSSGHLSFEDSRSFISRPGTSGPGRSISMADPVLKDRFEAFRKSQMALVMR